MNISTDKKTTEWLVRMRSGRDLSNALGVSYGYIAAMQRNGFNMPGGKASVLMAHNFIEKSDDFVIDKRTQSKKSNESKLPATK